ncbi:MAG TPA: alpha/beta hydrolase [Pseudoduganella sp.]|jgi:dienelactone hydrolase
MTLKALKSMTRIAVLAALAIFVPGTPAHAERVLEQQTISIGGESRRYFRLHDVEAGVSEAKDAAPVIVVVSGSGCAQFGSRLPYFFEKYPAPLDVYHLEKPHVGTSASGQPGTCSREFEQADNLQRRVRDTQAFLDTQPRLARLAPRTLALVGFSEGGRVVPIVAAASRKVGWLAVAGSGGMRQSDAFLVFADRGVAPYANPYSRARLEQQFADIAGDPASLDRAFFGHPFAYWSSHLFHDPLPDFGKLDIPVVAAMGENDESEPIESGRLLKEYFARHPDKPFRFIEYKGASHGLQSGETAHVKDFVAGLARWFRNDPAAFGQH